MAKKEEARRPRFSMSSTVFCELWNNILTGTDDGSGNTDWYRFVLNCWERFEAENTNALAWHHDNVGPLETAGQRYAFMSERCYSKCATIRRGLKKVGVNVDYPAGYLSRSGKAKNARPTYEELGLIFRSDATYEGPSS
tara:strand:- start:2530 stop:2946 length:417 start_codon:yes stop_codon:yes gene_type:complete